MHPSRQFPGFVGHVSFCLHVLLGVTRPLCSLREGGGGQGTVTMGMFPRGCEDSVVRMWSLSKGVGGTTITDRAPAILPLPMG